MTNTTNFILKIFLKAVKKLVLHPNFPFPTWLLYLPLFYKFDPLFNDLQKKSIFLRRNWFASTFTNLFSFTLFLCIGISIPNKLMWLGRRFYDTT